MKRLIINAIAVCLFMLVSVGSFAQSKEEMKSLVATMNQEMIDLVKAGRYEAMGKYYDENAISLPNYRVMEKGFKLILNNNLGRQKAGYKVLDAQRTTTELILGEDMMVDIGTNSQTVTFPGLTEPKVYTGKYINVWKKDKDGNWKLAAETWNADKSPNDSQQGRSQGQQGGTPSNVKLLPSKEGGTRPSSGTEQKPGMDTKDGKK